MSRHIVSLSHEHLTSFDLEAFMTHVAALTQHPREAFTTPFPKAPNRWLSHYHFTPRPLTLTQDGDVEGGLSGLVGRGSRRNEPSCSARGSRPRRCAHRWR